MDAASLHLDKRHTRQVRPAARLIVLNKARQKEVLPSPEELISLICAVAREQDRNAFAQLFAYFAPRIKSFLLRSGLADSVAEEVTQEVMIAVWQKASYFDPGKAGASTWVFTIARNQRIDRLRRTQSRKVDHLLDPSDEPDSLQMTCIVPANLAAICNGNLRSETHISDQQKAFTWFVSYPINLYNVTFYIGKYTHFNDDLMYSDS